LRRNSQAKEACCCTSGRKSSAPEDDVVGRISRWQIIDSARKTRCKREDSVTLHSRWYCFFGRIGKETGTGADYRHTNAKRLSDLHGTGAERQKQNVYKYLVQHTENTTTVDKIGVVSTKQWPPIQPCHVLITPFYLSNTNGGRLEKSGRYNLKEFGCAYRKEPKKYKRVQGHHEIAGGIKLVRQWVRGYDYIWCRVADRRLIIRTMNQSMKLPVSTLMHGEGEGSSEWISYEDTVVIRLFKSSRYEPIGVILNSGEDSEWCWKFGHCGCLLELNRWYSL